MKPKIVGIFIVAMFLQISCGYQDTPMIELKGPDDVNDLVLFYKKDATYEQKEFFQNNVIHKPHPEGLGYELQDGVIDLFSIRADDYEGYAINFASKAGAERRATLKKAIESSPVVFRVYENVVPNQISDLPGKKSQGLDQTPDRRDAKELKSPINGI